MPTWGHYFQLPRDCARDEDPGPLVLTVAMLTTSEAPIASRK
jgi:hypothetical protein